MGRLSDLCNQIGNANHIIAQSSQALAEELSATTGRVEDLDKKQVLLDQINENIANVKAELARLEEQKRAMSGDLLRVQTALAGLGLK